MKYKDSFHPYAMITIIFWSLAYVFTRLALQHFSAFSLGFLRYFTASVTLLVIGFVIKFKIPDKSDIKWFLLSGFTGFFLYMITFNKGCETVSSSTGSVIIAIVPIITALLARIVYHEQLGVIQWLAILIAFVGVVILKLLNSGFTMNTGILWLVGASILLSIYNLTQRHLTKKYSAVQSSAFSIFSGTLMLSTFLPGSVKELATVTPIHIIYILILGIFSSAIAFIAWAKAFSKAKQTSYVSNYMFVTPFLASLLGFIIANERVETSTLIGGFVILLGLLIFNYGDRIIKTFFQKKAAGTIS